MPKFRQNISKKSNLRLRRRYQLCKVENQKTIYKSEYYSFLSIYKKSIKETNIKSWNQFVSENSRENPWGLVYKIARNRFRCDQLTQLKTKTGHLLTDSNDIANELIDNLFPTDDSIPNTEVHRNLKSSLEQLRKDPNYYTPNDKHFTTEEVSQVIKA